MAAKSYSQTTDGLCHACMHRYEHTHMSCFLASCFLSVLLAWDHVVNFPFISCSLLTTFPCSFLAFVYFWLAYFFAVAHSRLIFCRAPLILMLLIFSSPRSLCYIRFFTYFLLLSVTGFRFLYRGGPLRSLAIFSFMFLLLQLVLLARIQNHRSLTLMNSTLRIGKS